MVPNQLEEEAIAIPNPPNAEFAMISVIFHTKTSALRKIRNTTGCVEHTIHTKHNHSAVADPALVNLTFLTTMIEITLITFICLLIIIKTLGSVTRVNDPEPGR